MYRKIIQPLLFALPIERAHRLVILVLRLIGHIPGGRWLLRKSYAVKHPALEREVFGVRFANPVGIAAGFDCNAEAYRELAAMGFGFVEVGTVTPHAQPGNARPRIHRLAQDRAIISRTGAPNHGLERMIEHLRHPHGGVIVGCSIGHNALTEPDKIHLDYLKLFRNLYQYVDYFTVNLFHDATHNEHPAQLRAHILQILEPLFDFRRGQNRYRPVMLKVSPDMTDNAIDQICCILLETPLDGVVATDGTIGRAGLRTDCATLDKKGVGRLSGAPLRARAVEIVRRIRTCSGGNFPIIGVGGLMNAEQVKEMLDAGADLVQLYTGYVYAGPGLVGDICRALIVDAETQAAPPEDTQETEPRPTQGSAPETAQEPEPDDR